MPVAGCEALETLGGLSSPAGLCVWHVVGLQRSVREWANRQGWNGRAIEQKQAQDILVAALGMLAANGGHREARREFELAASGSGGSHR